MPTKQDAKQAELDAHLKLLKKDFPLDRRVVVRMVEKCVVGDDADLWETPSGKSFIIQLRRGNKWNSIIESLWEEWTHCLTWHITKDANHHPPEFWLQLGRINEKYRGKVVEEPAA